MRRAAVCLAFLASAASAASALAPECVPAPTPRALRLANAACARGARALAARDLPRASEAFERALALVPDYPDARMGLGHVAYARGLHDAALAHFTRARDAYARAGRAAIDAQQLRYEQAQRQIRDLQDAASGPRGATEGAPARAGDARRAVEALRRVRPPARGEPPAAPAEVYYHRGNALFQLGRTEEAIADWETCARLRPDFGPVHNNLAVARFRLGHLLVARAELDRALALGAPVDPRFEAALAGPDATASAGVGLLRP